MAIRAYAKSTGIEIIGWYTDHDSGMKPPHLDKRPELQKLRAANNNNLFPILVHDMSRITRNRAYMEALQAEGVRIISVTEGELDAPTEIATAARAAYRGAELRRRALDYNARRRALGLPLGNTPALDEHRSKGHRAIVAKAEEFSELMRSHIDDIVRKWKGPLSKPIPLAFIAGELNERRIPTARGTSWHPSTVRNLLMRQRAKPSA